MNPAAGPSVEPLAARDIGRVAAIHRASFDEAWSADMIRRVLETAGAFGLAARDFPAPDRGSEAPVAAFALGRIAADECELLSLGVAPDRRRRGLGAALLDAAMIRAAAAGARRFFLEVGEFNTPARRLYESRGLTVAGRCRNYYALAEGGTMDALTMRRALSAPGAGPGPAGARVTSWRS